MNGMVWIPGATFLMGSDRHYPEEAPAHKATVDGFWMDTCPVTNREFDWFVRKTRYVTAAERAPDPADYPGARRELLVPFSTVFVAPGHRVSLTDPYRWWKPVPGADWRHPLGPGSSVRSKPDHPVVHMAWADVAAYAGWAGKEIPTEAEWELAARGGLDGAEYAWGDEFNPGGRWLANTWQGEFPVRNTQDDGYERTSPAGAFPASDYGLYDMIGNVWEWTSDWYAGHASGISACCGGREPGGREQSIDRLDPALIPRKVTKGGSHLCAPNYCRRYRPAARMAQPIDTSTSHLGFRCVVREGLAMARDTFIVFAASYDTLDAAEADYYAVRDLYLTSGRLETHDAAAIDRDDAGKATIVVMHEQPTRQGAWRELGTGLAGGALVALFPAVGIGTGPLLAAAGGGGLAALAGHVSAGLTRGDLKDLGDLLDERHSGLVVVAASDLDDRVEHVIRRARNLTRKPLRVDEQAVAKDIEAAASGPDQSYRHAVVESQAAVAEAEAEAAAAERAAEQYTAFRPPPADGGHITPRG